MAEDTTVLTVLGAITAERVARTNKNIKMLGDNILEPIMRDKLIPNITKDLIKLDEMIIKSLEDDVDMRLILSLPVESYESIPAKIWDGKDFMETQILIIYTPKNGDNGIYFYDTYRNKLFTNTQDLNDVLIPFIGYFINS